MPITHDTYLSATLARLWGAPNAAPGKLSAWDHPRHDPPRHRATPSTPAGLASNGQPAGAGVGRPPAKPLVEKL